MKNKVMNSFKNKKVVIGVGAGLLSLVLITGVTMFNPKQEVELMPDMGMQNTYVIPSQKKVILSGNVVPTQTKTFHKDLTKGENLTIHVKDGDHVSEGDVLITYHNIEMTNQIKDLNEQIAKLNADKSKLSTEGTPASKSINKQIKVIESEKSKLQQETKSKINQVLKQLDELGKQKNELNPEDENYAISLAEIEAQIENCYVQKNDLEYNLPLQVGEFDEQINDLKSELSDQNQETLGELDEQINSLVKEKSKLEEKEYIEEIASFDGIVSLVEDSNTENAPILKLKSPDFYVSSSVSEKDYARLSEGMEAEVLLMAINKTVNGKIIFVDEDPMQTTANQTTASSYLVKVSLDDQTELANGYQAQISLKLANELISIPTEAILLEDGVHYVLVQIDGESVKQQIEVAEEKDGYTKIKSGLNEKDEILLNPSAGESVE